MTTIPDKHLGVLEQVEALDYESIRDAFCRELELAAHGKTASLPFIRHALPESPIVRPGEIFQVFVIGGTNTETATVRYNIDGTATVLEYHVHRGLTKFRRLEGLLSFIDKHVDAIAEAIAINFAFSLSPRAGSKGQLDGVMQGHDGKGHLFKGLEGRPVGATIEAYFLRKHKRKITVSVVNDAVCLVASVVEGTVDRNKIVGGIVGTGYNLSFFLDRNTIINVQPAGFSGFIPSATGRAVDAQSKNVGKQLYEKEVAAGELFRHYNVIVRSQRLRARQLKSSEELAVLAITDESWKGDIARALFRRSAALVAAQFAGLYNFKKRPAGIKAVMEGGLFWEGPDYKEMFAEELARLGVPTDAIIFELLDRSGIIGMAKLVTGDCYRM